MKKMVKNYILSISIIAFFLISSPTTSETQHNHLTGITKDWVVKEFTKGLKQGLDFSQVRILFFSMDDFPKLMEVMQNSPYLSEKKKKMFQKSWFINAQRNEFKRQFETRIFQRWEKVTQKIRKNEIQLVVLDYNCSQIPSTNIKKYKVKLTIEVIKDNKKTTVKKTIYLISIDGQPKIISMFKNLT